MNAIDSLVRPLRMERSPASIVARVHEIIASRGPEIPVRLWDGTLLGPDVGYRLVLRHPWSLRAMLVPPSDLTAGEAYLHDDIDVEGSMVAALHDVSTLLSDDLGLADRMALARLLLSLPRPPQRDRTRRARLSGIRHSKGRDAEAVRFHYDVSAAFYRLFLGRELVYSCAYFDGDPAEALADPGALDRAQVRKLDMICRKLRLRPGMRLLDIGCGWGSLVVHAATHHGVEAVGITLSPEQAALAVERVERAGLAGRVEIRVEDYRETAGSFDAVASVGMFEHVGESRFGTYFARAFELTRPGGLFLNHAITTGRSQRVRNLAADSGSFAGRHVFPDGTLAPAHVAVRHLEMAGFELIDVHQLRRHYALTLRHWLAELERHASAAHAEAGRLVYRTWRAYMAGSAVGFERGDLGVVQVLGARDESDLPLRRTWMEPQLP